MPFDSASVGGPITSIFTPGSRASIGSFVPKLANTLRLPIACRLRTASAFLRFVSPRNASWAARAAGTSGDAFSLSTCASTSAATSCMSDSRATILRARRLRPLEAVGPSACGSSFGSSVHGCTTSSGLSPRMIAPGAPAKPEMWSLWRCVATTMSSFLPQSRAICPAIFSIQSSGVESGRFVDPKSISTLRSRSPAYENVSRKQSPKPTL